MEFLFRRRLVSCFSYMHAKQELINNNNLTHLFLGCRVVLLELYDVIV